MVCQVGHSESNFLFIDCSLFGVTLDQVWLVVFVNTVGRAAQGAMRAAGSPLEEEIKMKIIGKVVLLALAATSSGAMAQSELTVYGRVDGGVRYSHFADIDGVAQDSKLELASGHTTGNRFGIKGAEGLGGGLKVIFTLEAGFTLDDGKSAQQPKDKTLGSRLFSRQAFVGLEGSGGTVAVGRLGGLTSGAGAFHMSRYDPFLSAWQQAGMKAFSLVGLRLDNAVVYRTPTVGGLMAEVMHSTQTEGVEDADNGKNETYTGVGAQYKIGNGQLGLMYEQVGKKVAAGLPDQKVLTFGAFYNFPIATAYFNYQRNTDGPVSGVTGSAADADSYMVGLKASLPRGAGDLMASYQLRDGAAFQLNGKTYEADLQIFSLGYLYPLSKRTMFYASYVVNVGDKSWGKNAAQGDFAAATASQRATYNAQVAAVGLRHTF